MLKTLDEGMQQERLERCNPTACTSKEMWFLRGEGEDVIWKEE